MSAANECVLCGATNEVQETIAGLGVNHRVCKYLGGCTDRVLARAAELEALADLVRMRCRDAVPEWAPELREALARLDAKETKR